ncbi:MAG: ATP-binding cassette domain-containing protein [Deltaproteobacteria bacterium]|nr:ATP-binding cassette domain-containing protein [Deltaproteobacteria bacterium]MBW2191441.1 ATP-binding cassette domain-containing protein [Deltaproteobacteria bacterium]MBW2403132.1 ATP-binding cassette domain-containing protein [Deltaproteobacteria bacterium]
MALFEVRGLRKAFGRHVVLDGLDIDIFAGEIVTIIGESGSGKSILLKAMMGLLDIDEGTIRFDGADVAGQTEQEWTQTRRRIGMLFQESALFDSLDVYENVAYALRVQTTMTEEEIATRVSETLALVGLPGIETMAPSDLSGGMRKRVALARAVAVRPEVVFYDEPAEGLDPINVTRVNRLLLGLQKTLQVTSVVVTHNLKAAFAISDRLALIHDGAVAATAAPDAFLESSNPVVREFIGDRMRRVLRAS